MGRKSKVNRKNHKKVKEDDETSMISDDFEQEQNTEQDERHLEEEDQEGEDVMAMAMAEKANALIRGKSADFDRTFVPRVSTRRSSVPDFPEMIVDDEQGENNVSPALPVPSRPGAFSVSQGVQIVSQDDLDEVEEQTEEGIGDVVDHDGNKTIMVPRASLVSVATGATDMVDLEDPQSGPHRQQEVPPIAQVVDSSTSFEHVPNKNELPDRRKRLFRVFVIVALLVIASSLIAVLVKLNQPDPKKRGSKGPPPPHRGQKPPPYYYDKYPNVNQEDVPEYERGGGDNPIFAAGGTNNLNDRNSTIFGSALDDFGG